MTQSVTSITEVRNSLFLYASVILWFNLFSDSTYFMIKIIYLAIVSEYDVTKKVVQENHPVYYDDCWYVLKNFLFLGQSGLGKATFINTLFDSIVISPREEVDLDMDLNRTEPVKFVPYIYGGVKIIYIPRI